jgi:epsilon-lactone hydrolase
MKAGWSPSVTLERMRSDLDELHAGFRAISGFSAVAGSAGGVPAEWVETNASVPNHRQRVVLYLHGGGFATGSIRASRNFASWLAEALRARVLVLGYRLAPEHIFPAQLEDAATAYRWLLAEHYLPSNLVLAGDSAGGGLGLALLGELARSHDSMPSCALLMTPWVDMRCQGETYRSNSERDPVANREIARMMAATYLGADGCLDDPRATPVLAPFTGFPPLMIQAAGRDVFLDDARDVHTQGSAAGVHTRLDVWPDMIHQWQLYASELDEGRRALQVMADFADQYA